MNDNGEERAGRLTTGGWIALIVLAALLGWAIWFALRGWGALAGVGIDTAGWVALVLGVVVTVGVGGGLMALLFYSSRNNFDR